MSDDRQGDKKMSGSLLRSPITIPTELPRVSIIPYNPLIQQLFINVQSQENQF